MKEKIEAIHLLFFLRLFRNTLLSRLSLTAITRPRLGSTRLISASLIVSRGQFLHTPILSSTHCLAFNLLLQPAFSGFASTLSVAHVLSKPLVTRLLSCLTTPPSCHSLFFVSVLFLVDYGRFQE